MTPENEIAPDRERDWFIAAAEDIAGQRTRLGTTYVTPERIVEIMRKHRDAARCECGARLFPPTCAGTCEIDE